MWSVTTLLDLQRYIEDRRDEVIEFAAELIRTPSPNPPGDEQQVASVLEERLAQHGLRTEVITRTPTRPNVLARLDGPQIGRRLILNGHIDTKPPGDFDEWETDPYTPTIIDGELYGLGAMDMKGQVAAIAYAAIALAQVAPPPKGSLILALTADEECGSAFGAGYLANEHKVEGDAALVAEPSSIHKDWEYLALATRGFSGFRIKVYGTQMHSSISDQLPSVNASVKMAHVLLRLEKDLKINYPSHWLYPSGVTVNIGVFVNGGIYYGVYPGYAEFGVDVRTVPGMTKEGLRRDIETFLDNLRQEDPSLQVEFEFEDEPLGWNEGTEISEHHPIVQAALQASDHVLGSRPALGGFPAGTDAGNFQVKLGIPTVPAFGPGLLPLAHKPNEHIATDSIIEAAKIYALTAKLYLDECC